MSVTAANNILQYTLEGYINELALDRIQREGVQSLALSRLIVDPQDSTLADSLVWHHVSVRVEIDTNKTERGCK